MGGDSQNSGGGSGFDVAHTANSAGHAATSGFGYGQKAASFADHFHLLDSHAGQMVNGFFNNPLVNAGAGGLGAVLGGVGMAHGIGEMINGKDGYAKRQGAFDFASAGIGTVSSAAAGLSALTGAGMLGGASGALGAGLAGAAPVLGALGPIGVAAGLAAVGNGYTRDHGWFGKDAQGNNRDGFEFAMNNASAANSWGHSIAGNGLGGDIVGGIAGGAAGLGTGALALGADVVGGAASITESLGNGIGGFFGAKNAGTSIVNGIGSGLGAAANFAGDAASTIGNGIGNVAGSIGNGIGNVAGGIGNALSHLW